VAALALLLAAQAAAPPPLPPDLARAAAEIRSALAGADGAVAALGHCAQDNPRHEQAYQGAISRYLAVQREAEAVFGPPAMPEPDIGMAAPQCGPLVVARFVRLAASEAARADAAFRRQTAAMPGLWFGPLRMCGGAVASVTAATDEPGMPALVIAFSHAMAERFAAETASRVGKPMSVRLDGRLIADPMINEPILGGLVQLSPATADTAAIAAAAARSC
jgi:hypothetical protein